MPPTLYIKGSLHKTNPKQNEEILAEIVPIKYILDVINYKMSKDIINFNDRILILKSETGSGKTTAFVVELFRRFYTNEKSQFLNNPSDIDFEKYQENISIFNFKDEHKKSYINHHKLEDIPKETREFTHKIICTQPKILTATEKARELGRDDEFFSDIKLGQNIGYQTGPFKEPPIDNKSILYATIGTLMQQLKTWSDKKIMDTYDFILIDEAHERSLELDTTLRYLYDFMKRNLSNPDTPPNVKMPMVVLMSATIDVAKFANFFRTPIENSIFVTGEKSQKEIIFSEYDYDDYYSAIIEKIKEINKVGVDDPKNQNDILIFLMGNAEVRKVSRAIEESDINEDVIVLSITGEKVSTNDIEVQYVANADEYQLSEMRKIYNKPKAKRKVICSTDVAETGLTIPTLKYVIEPGWQRTPVYDPKNNINVLISKAAPKSSIEQRWGRVGRKFPGIVYTLYTKETYEQLDDYKLPDIYTKNVTKMLLEVLYTNIKAEELMKPLDLTAFEKVLKNCIGYELINREDSKQDSITNNCMNILNIGNMEDAQKLDKKYTIYTIIENDKKYKQDFKLYPPRMLDNFTQDSIINSILILRNLGMLGSYYGYIASKIPRLSVEGIRMIMISFMWGVSLSDISIIATFADYSRKDYLYLQEPRLIKSKKGTSKQPKYNKYLFIDIIKTLYGYRDKEIKEIILSTNSDSLQTDKETNEDIGMRVTLPRIEEQYKDINYVNPIFLSNIICDEMIEPLILVQLYSELLRHKNISDIKSDMEKFGINFKSFIEIMKVRNDVYKTFKLLGYVDEYENINMIKPKIGLNLLEEKMNPVINYERRKTQEEFGGREYHYIMDSVLRLKKCIYGGYKMNYATFDEKSGRYISLTGTKFTLNADSQLGKMHPKTIIYNSLFAKKSMKGLQYIPESDSISILDGYIF